MHRFNLAFAAAVVAGSLTVGIAFADNSTPSSNSPSASGQVPATSSGQPATQDAQPDPNEQICKREKITGSFVGVKVCQTRAEWDEEEREDRQESGKLPRNSKTQNGN